MRLPIASAILFLAYSSSKSKDAFVCGGWIDEDTPQDKRVTNSLIDGTEYKLVSNNDTGA